MKKRLYLLSILFLSIVFTSFFLIAQLGDIECEEGDDSCKKDKAYSCLEEKVDSRGCGNLGPEEKIFSLLANGDCKSEVENDNRFMSDIKYTAQAVLALGGDSDAEDWLISKTIDTSNLNWFLQIDAKTEDVTSCTVSYSDTFYTVQINDDKTLGSGAGPCLDLSSNGYWLEVDRSCYGQEISISCVDFGFTTNLLYQEIGSGTIYVADHTSSASAGGETMETVNSSCFGQDSCDYEGSLWTTLVLNSLNYDMSIYLPILVTGADDNEELLPEAFLFRLTGEFRNDLLGKQLGNKWWDESGDRFYDTALALYAFQFEDPIQKTNSIRWLLDESQGNDGCWDNGNIKNTAFLLFAIDPRSVGIDDGSTVITCENTGFSCRSSSSVCTLDGGNVLDSYSCVGGGVCCDQEKVLESCSVQGGVICNFNQECMGGVDSDASDLFSGETCCIGGTCEIPSETPETNECEAIGGTCRITSCFEGETESFEACDFSADLCCIGETRESEGVSAFWIWFLLILILLVVLGIIFREKLRPFWFKLKMSFNKIMKKKTGPPSGTRPDVGPSPMAYRGIPRMTPAQRRPSTRPPIRRSPATKQSGDLKDVLKKLKDLGR